MPDVDHLFDAVAKAETGSFKNPFMRTTSIPPGGSTAYGPVQMTGSTMKDYMTRKPQIFQPNELGYMSRFMDQAKKFNQNGNVPTNTPGYAKEFDYGGTGSLTNLEDRSMYTNVVKKIMGDLSTGRSIPSFIQRWRGAVDPGYASKVTSALANK